jgi:septal ring factor EnvC (AmiA/AmiB activator)
MNTYSPIIINAKKAQEHYNKVKMEHADILTGLENQRLQVEKYNQQQMVEKQNQANIQREQEEKQMQTQKDMLEHQRKMEELEIKRQALSSDGEE